MTSTATMRHLEVRVGELLGPAVPGNPQFRPTSLASEVDAPRETKGQFAPSAGATDDGLDRHDRAAFRAMAAHPEIVDEVIAASTDDPDRCQCGHELLDHARRRPFYCVKRRCACMRFRPPATPDQETE